MKRRTTGIALLATASLVTAIGSGAAASAAPRSSEPHWTDRQVVEGVTFAKGPVAEKLGLSQQLPADVTSKETSEALAIENGLLDEMMSNHKRDVHNAVRSLTSGDPYAVEDGRHVLAEAFDASVETKYPDLAPNVRAESRCGLLAACAAVAVLGLALGVAVVVVAEAAVIGHAAVYAKQALWDKSLAGSAGASGGAPAFSAAEFNAIIASRLAR